MTLAASRAQSDDQHVNESFVKAHKKALVVLALLTVVAVGYLAFNVYEGGVV